jgi:CheY-specific phosphatase CheX
MNKLETELYKSAALTFEELAFMFETPEGETSDGAAMEAAACVNFRGIFSGKLIIQVYDGLLAAIAMNMLGEDEAPSYKEQCDALGEIANVICGNVLPAIAGSKEVFHLNAPVIYAADTELADKNVKPSAEKSLPLDEGWAHISLFIDEGSIPEAA